MRHRHRLPFSAMYVVHSVSYIRSIRDQDNLGMGVHIIWDPRPRAWDYCVVNNLKIACRYLPRPRWRRTVWTGLSLLTSVGQHVVRKLISFPHDLFIPWHNKRRAIHNRYFKYFSFTTILLTSSRDLIFNFYSTR